MGPGRRPAAHRLESDGPAQQGDHPPVRGGAAPASTAGARHRSPDDRRRRGGGRAARLRGPGRARARPSGGAGVRGVLELLAQVQPKLVEPDSPGAFRYLAARNRKRALTVLFTDVIDRFASDALVANVATLRPRHLPLAVTLRNPEIDAVAAARPETPRDAYRKAAAEELLHAREEALGFMRRAGVLVIDVTPERAAQAVVAKYLDLKRRGTL